MICHLDRMEASPQLNTGNKFETDSSLARGRTMKACIEVIQRYLEEWKVSEELAIKI